MNNQFFNLKFHLHINIIIINLDMLFNNFKKSLDENKIMYFNDTLYSLYFNKLELNNLKLFINVLEIHNFMFKF